MAVTEALVPRQPARAADLGTTRLPDLRWDNAANRSNLTELYEWAVQAAADTIGWYLGEKRQKSSWSRALRALAAVFATLGGVIPLAALTIGRAELGNWGFVLLALAAGCIAFDRYFGYSSAWLRYVSAAMSLRAKLDEFQLAWLREQSAIGERTLSAAETRRLVDLVRGFVGAVHSVVRDETQSWLVEFHTNLADLESKLQQSRSAGSDTSIQSAQSLSAQKQ